MNDPPNNAKFCFSDAYNNRYHPVDVETAEAAAHEAAHEYAYLFRDESNPIVFVGRCDWRGPKHIASFLSGSEVVDLLDERLYDEGNVKWIRETLESQYEERRVDSLTERLQSVVADWLAGLDDPPWYFFAKDVTEFEVVTHPDDEGGPEVREVTNATTD